MVTSEAHVALRPKISNLLICRSLTSQESHEKQPHAYSIRTAQWPLSPAWTGLLWSGWFISWEREAPFHTIHSGSRFFSLPTTVESGLHSTAKPNAVA